MTTSASRRGYDRSSQSDPLPEEEKSIDARDPQARARGLRGAHFDLNKNLISGTQVATGKVFSRQPPPVLDQLNKPSSDFVRAFPNSAAVTGDKSQPSPQATAGVIQPRLTPPAKLARPLAIQPFSLAGSATEPPSGTPAAAAAPSQPGSPQAPSSPKPAVSGLAARFGADWTTLNPAAHGFGSAAEMEGEAKAQGFPNALAMQRNRVLQTATDKQPSQTGMGMNANDRALAAARALPTGAKDFTGPTPGVRTIVSRYGIGTNVPGASIARVEGKPVMRVPGTSVAQTVPPVNAAKPDQPSGVSAPSGPLSGLGQSLVSSITGQPAYSGLQPPRRAVVNEVNTPAGTGVPGVVSQAPQAATAASSTPAPNKPSAFEDPAYQAFKANRDTVLPFGEKMERFGVAADQAAAGAVKRVANGAFRAAARAISPRQTPPRDGMASLGGRVGGGRKALSKPDESLLTADKKPKGGADLASND